MLRRFLQLRWLSSALLVHCCSVISSLTKEVVLVHKFPWLKAPRIDSNDVTHIGGTLSYNSPFMFTCKYLNGKRSVSQPCRNVESLSEFCIQRHAFCFSKLSELWWICIFPRGGSYSCRRQLMIITAGGAGLQCGSDQRRHVPLCWQNSRIKAILDLRVKSPGDMKAFSYFLVFICTCHDFVTPSETFYFKRYFLMNM